MRQVAILLTLFATVCCSCKLKAEENKPQVFYWVSDKTGSTDDFLAKYNPLNHADCPHYIARIGGMSLQRGASVAFKNGTPNFNGLKAYYQGGGEMIVGMNSGLMNKSYEYADRQKWIDKFSGDVGIITKAKQAGASRVVMFMQSPLSKGQADDFNPNVISEKNPNGGATLDMRVEDCFTYAEYIWALKPDGIDVTFGLIDAYPAKSPQPGDAFHAAYVKLAKGLQQRGMLLEEIQYDMKTNTVKNSANKLLMAMERSYNEIFQATGTKVRMTWYTWWGSADATTGQINQALKTALTNIANHPKRVYMTGLLLDGNNENRSGIVDLIPTDINEKRTITARVNEAYSILERLGTMNPTQKGDPILGPTSSGGPVEVPKARPSEVRVQVNDAGTLKISWKDDIKDETGFVVERKTEDAAWDMVYVTQSDVTMHTDSGLMPFTKYYYRLRAAYAGDTLSAATDPVLARTSPATTPALPDGWSGICYNDTNVSTAYQAYFANDTFTIDAGDGDFWGNQDRAGYFIYRALNGDGEIIAQITQLDEVQSYAQCGVMIREGHNTGSKFAAQMIMATPGAILRERVETDGAVNQKPVPNTKEKAPIWVKLKREGLTKFTGYTSTNGETWKEVRSVTVPMNANNVYVGLVATAHTADATGVYAFANVKVNSPNTIVKPDVEPVNVYPNPADKTLNILINNNNATVQLFSLSGKLVHAAMAGKKHVKLNVENVSAGIYLLKIIDGQRTFTQKVMIE